MQHTLRRMQAKRAKGDSGFTLVELLVVVVIIGILVAIAIPLYLNYRKGAANKTAESDVRAAISSVEQFYTANGNAYPTNAERTPAVPTLNAPLVFTPAASPTSVQTANVSPGNMLGYNFVTPTYRICGMSADGGQVYRYDSIVGGSVKKSVLTTVALCIAGTT